MHCSRLRMRCACSLTGTGGQVRRTKSKGYNGPVDRDGELEEACREPRGLSSLPRHAYKPLTGRTSELNAQDDLVLFTLFQRAFVGAVVVDEGHRRIELRTVSGSRRTQDVRDGRRKAVANRRFVSVDRLSGPRIPEKIRRTVHHNASAQPFRNRG